MSIARAIGRVRIDALVMREWHVAECRYMYAVTGVHDLHSYRQSLRLRQLRLYKTLSTRVSAVESRLLACFFNGESRL